MFTPQLVLCVSKKDKKAWAAMSDHPNKRDDEQPRIDPNKRDDEQPRMVERIRFTVCARPPPMFAVSTSTALVLLSDVRNSSVPERRPTTAQSAHTTDRSPCIAALSLQCRPAAPHETADGYGAEPCISKFEACATVRVTLADGCVLVCAPTCLASHSSMLHTLLENGGRFREGSGWSGGDGWDVCLDAYEPAVVRGMVAWMQAEDGPRKRLAAGALLTPERVVSAARCAHYLEVGPVLSAAVRQLSLALDQWNAPSILLLARELGDVDLERKSILFMLAELDAVLEAENWLAIPQQTRDTLQVLREATMASPLLAPSGIKASNPFTSGAGVTDTRELLGMIRESLAEIKDRFEEAIARQALEADLDAVSVNEKIAKRQKRTETVLKQQRARIDALETYFASCNRSVAAIELFAAPSEDTIHGGGARRTTAGSAGPPVEGGTFAGGLPTDGDTEGTPQGKSRIKSRMHPPAAAAAAPCTGHAAGREATLVPTYEWQAISEATHGVPPGLQVDLPLDDGPIRRPRRVRIPPSWSLRVWLNNDIGFWRMDVTAETTIRELRESVAASAGVDALYQIKLHLGDGHRLRDYETVRSTDLFNHRTQLSVEIA